jgi:hypothetical protein
MARGCYGTFPQPCKWWSGEVRIRTSVLASELVPDLLAFLTVPHSGHSQVKRRRKVWGSCKCCLVGLGGNVFTREFFSLDCQFNTLPAGQLFLLTQGLSGCLSCCTPFFLDIITEAHQPLRNKPRAPATVINALIGAQVSPTSPQVVSAHAWCVLMIGWGWKGAFLLLINIGHTAEEGSEGSGVQDWLVWGFLQQRTLPLGGGHSQAQSKKVTNASGAHHSKHFPFCFTHGPSWSEFLLWAYIRLPVWLLPSTWDVAALMSCADV